MLSVEETVYSTDVTAQEGNSVFISDAISNHVSEPRSFVMEVPATGSAVIVADNGPHATITCAGVLYTLLPVPTAVT